ncbi:MAG: hypothetical protein WBR18_14225 [Anaerolineales bacterium]
MSIDRRRSPAAIVLTVAALLAACGLAGQPAPVESATTYHGTIQRSCAPWDGAALAVNLDRSSGRGPDQLQIQLWRATLPAPAEVLALPEQSAGGGQVFICDGVPDCAAAERARLVFESAPDDPTVRGRLQASWPGQPGLEVRFSATWAEQQAVLCG